jgi:hypothetical protein
MNSSRSEKLASLSGVGSVLMLTGVGLLGVYDYLPSSDRLVEIFSGNSTNVMLVGYLGLFSAVLLLWFSGSIYTALTAYEGSKGRLATIAFGGGVASSIAIAAGFSAVLALGARAGSPHGLDASMAVALYDLYGILLGQMAAFTFAVLIGATGILSLRTEIFPSWFGWVSILIAVGLVSPIGYFVLAFTIIWLLGLSVALFRRTD